MRVVIALVAILAGGGAQAALLGRAPLTPGGTNYQAYYDDALNITWLADANLADTSGYDSNGLFDWQGALSWIDSLNALNSGAGFLGSSDWRLPKMTDTNVGCSFAYSGTACGYNVDPTTSEMAHLFYATLANVAGFDASGIQRSCTLFNPCTTNTGPFTNLRPANYWSATEYAADATNAWEFFFYYGLQANYTKDDQAFATAVLDGDPLAVVPVPAAAWLFGGAVGALGLARRRTGTNSAASR